MEVCFDERKSTAVFPQKRELAMSKKKENKPSGIYYVKPADPYYSLHLY
jgi:hypothetical protein